MTTGTRQVAAERQRERIPTTVLVGFDGLTNDELAWLARNASDPAGAAYAGWELEYREQFGIEVYIDHESGETKRKEIR